MKKLITGSAILALIAVLVVGCINPFDGDNKRSAAAEAASDETVPVDVSVAPGDALGASSIFNPPVLGIGQDFWVEVEVYNSAGRQIAQEGLAPVLTGEDITGYSASLRLETGALTFIVVARVYTWETETSEYLYYGEKTQVIVTGGNAVTVATSSYANLCSEIEINNLPPGYNSVMVGVVGNTFDIYADIIDPFIASGLSWRAMDSIVSRVFVAGGEGSISGGTSTVYMKEWNMPRPWQEEGTHNIFVMLQDHLDMWVPGTVDGLGNFEPAIGQAYLYSPDYFGAVSLDIPEVTYEGFNYLIASKVGGLVEASGILFPKGDVSLLDELGNPLLLPDDVWYASAAIFPAGYNVFDANGELITGADPFAQGATRVPLNSLYFDGSATFGMFADFFGGDGEEDGGGMPSPWYGTIGENYEVYVLLYRLIEVPDNGGTRWTEEMYIGGNLDVGGIFQPTVSPFTLLARPFTVPINVSGLNFKLFSGGGGTTPQ